MKKFAMVLAVLAVGGCATIVRGTDEQVQFMSEPSGASVQTSIGLAVRSHLVPSRFHASTSLSQHSICRTTSHRTSPWQLG